MFVSTRSTSVPVNATQALLEGLAPDGGLYVPLEFPRLSPGFLERGGLTYAELAAAIIAPFFPELDGDAILGSARSAYAQFPEDPAPLVRAGDMVFLELFRGQTLAFKDFALSLMGDLVRLSSAARSGSSGEGRDGHPAPKERIILVATSGDTGKAALQGFADRSGVRILVFYPSEGVSEIQRLQMVTHEAANGAALAVRGNFDDAQRGVKALFADRELAAALASGGIVLGSANSINIGRLLPQLVYYAWAWRAARREGLVAEGEKLDFVVPTGNFGDALAGDWARRIGVPVGSITVATNRNRVLADFFASGRYDRNRDFHPTTSPSMDILAASNLERLFYDLTDKDPARVEMLMRDFQERGWIELSSAERATLAQSGFQGAWASDEEAAAEIGRVFRETGYLMDTHTAVAASVWRRSGSGGAGGAGGANGSERPGGPGGAHGAAKPAVILSTASPFKFPAAVAQAIGLTQGADELATARALADRAGLELPSAVARLGSLPERHRGIIESQGMKEALLDFALGVGR